MQKMTKQEKMKEAIEKTVIRTAEDADVDELWRIYRQGKLTSLPSLELGITRGDVYREFFDLSPAEVIAQKDILAKHVYYERIFVAAHKMGRVYGMVLADSAEDDSIWLQKLNVAKSMQGLGLGSRLIDKVIELNQPHPVHLRVAAHNVNAHNLYTHKGFEHIATIFGAYTISGKPVDQWHMTYPGTVNMHGSWYGDDGQGPWIPEPPTSIC